jgi:hypothetical protein
MRFNVFPTGLATVMFAGTAIAEGVSINPGMWEMTSTMTMSTEFNGQAMGFEMVWVGKRTGDCE